MPFFLWQMIYPTFFKNSPALSRLARESIFLEKVKSSHRKVKVMTLTLLSEKKSQSHDNFSSLETFLK